MNTIRRGLLTIALALLVGASVSAEENVYYDVINKIIDEALDNSQVMDTASWLTDVYGPRNSKSTGYVLASKWARQRLEDYGLENARREPFEFDIGWENMYTSVHMMAPQYTPIIAYPAGWSDGTDGKVAAEAKYIDFRQYSSIEELDALKGTLEGYVIFPSPIQQVSPHFEYMAIEFTQEELDAQSEIKIPVRNADDEGERRDGRDQREERLSREQIYDFIFAEDAVAIVRPDGSNGFGIVDAAINGYAMNKRLWEHDAPPPITEIVVAAEQYNRMMRILEKGIPVKMELEVRVSFHDEGPDFNVVAEIPGTDLAHEFVVVGAHLQSESGGTGAIDDAAGVAIVMEAVRILKAIEAKPRRTIRIGLWGSHEMGTYGNRAHVAANFADFKKKEYKKDYHNLSAYFNWDIGTGNTRSVSIMGNEELRAIFLEWMKPLRTLGFTHLTNSGMAHEAYREVGLPGFYFDQDRRPIDDMNAHKNQDLYERLVPSGMKQSAIVAATFVYQTAMRDEKLPRVAPLPW